MHCTRAWVRRGVCVCPMRGTGGEGAWLPKTAVGGGEAAVDIEEVSDGERVRKGRKKKKRKLGEDTFPGNSVRGGDPLVDSGA